MHAPALRITAHNSSHLQDFSNAFPTKDRVKLLCQGQGTFVAINIKSIFPL